MITLESLGWNTFFQNEFNNYNGSGFIAGRVSVEHKERYLVITKYGELKAEISGKLLYTSETPADFPKTGDWIVGNYFEAESKLIIHSVLPRQTKFSRSTAGSKTEEQVLAANINYLFIMQSMDNDFSLRRLERYISTALQGKIQPVIVLSKTDLHPNSEEIITRAQSVAGDIPVIGVSSVTGSGIDNLKDFLGTGVTSAFAGSSGIGKSTLANMLIGEEVQKTQQVRESDSKGRHTTTSRELFVLPSGGIIIDTPGMREFQLWKAEDGVEAAFDEIQEYAQQCHFADCTHTKEKGCAVLSAIEKGLISGERYNSYLRLQKELKYLESKTDINAMLEEKRKWKIIHKEQKRINKNR